MRKLTKEAMQEIRSTIALFQKDPPEVLLGYFISLLEDPPEELFKKEGE